MEDKIINDIASSPKVLRYLELEKIINNNEQIKTQINNLKNIQKEIVHAEALNKQTMLKKLKNDYDKLYEEFLDSPLINEYLDLQTELNDFLQNFTNIVEENIKKDLLK